MNITTLVSVQLTVLRRPTVILVVLAFIPVVSARAKGCGQYGNDQITMRNPTVVV
jgi:hypothetical protein